MLKINLITHIYIGLLLRTYDKYNSTRTELNRIIINWWGQIFPQDTATVNTRCADRKLKNSGWHHFYINSDELQSGTRRKLTYVDTAAAGSETQYFVMNVDMGDWYLSISALTMASLRPREYISLMNWICCIVSSIVCLTASSCLEFFSSICEYNAFHFYHVHVLTILPFYIKTIKHHPPSINTHTQTQARQSLIRPFWYGSTQGIRWHLSPSKFHALDQNLLCIKEQWLYSNVWNLLACELVFKCSCNLFELRDYVDLFLPVS